MADGVQWYCYSVLTLLLATDFVLPQIGAGALFSGPSGPAALAAFQWGAFVLPTLNYARERGWDMRATFGLRPPAHPKWLLYAALGGAALWGTVHAAIALKSGAWSGVLAPQVPEGLGGTPDSSVLASSFRAAAESSTALAALVATTALSPAVAEELLFRGLLLQALRSRLGRVDAVAMAGALFAAIHLDPGQFFGLSLLGFAAGGVALGSGGSVLPAMVMHFSYNAAAIAAGLAACQAL